jgi:hypothetical protein
MNLRTWCECVCALLGRKCGELIRTQMGILINQDSFTYCFYILKATMGDSQLMQRTLGMWARTSELQYRRQFPDLILFIFIHSNKS